MAAVEAYQQYLARYAAGPLSLDDLVTKTRLPTAKVAAAMTMLVLKGVVKQKPGSVFVRAR